jgi:hypothetical protein
MIQLLIHLWGDYLTQSDWMAQNKTKSSVAAWTHALVYSFPFLLLTGAAPRPALAGTVILVSHFLIDRYRLARYVVWAKNWLAPNELWGGFEGEWKLAKLWTAADLERLSIKHIDVMARMRRTPPFSACSSTGYPPSAPPWLAVWLLIIADNTLHLTINYIALRWL